MVKKTTEAEVVEESPTPEFKLRYKVKTSNGVYVIKRPVHRVGITNLILVTKAMPTSSARDDDGNLITSPADTERFHNVLIEWTEKVLPQIFVEGPGGITVEDMPGEDQYALFLSMFKILNLNQKDLFRIIE